jgi:hypothetical protein
MSKAAHPMRHAIALSVALLLAACSQSQVENSEKSAADPAMPAANTVHRPPPACRQVARPPVKPAPR